MTSTETYVEVHPAAFGQGAFAIRYIPKGRIIGEINGEVITDDDYTSDYCMQMGNGTRIEPEWPFRFMNHSCEPNAELIYYEPESVSADQEDLLNRLYVRALRVIKKGQEVTIDYAWPADHAIRCGCGAKKCRGWIVCPSELHLMK